MKKGYTLLEVSVTLGILGILIFMGMGIGRYVIENNSRIRQNQLLFQQASIAMDFMIAHVREAGEIEIIADANGTLSRMYLRVTRTGHEHTRAFIYGPATGEQNRLMFGGQVVAGAVGAVGQELARYIADIVVTVDREAYIMHIVITTESSTSRYHVEVEPVVLKYSVDVMHKIIR